MPVLKGAIITATEKAAVPAQPFSLLRSTVQKLSAVVLPAVVEHSAPGKEIFVTDFLETTFGKFIFKVKEGNLYSENDYWVDIEDLVATVGVTDYLQKSSGDVAFIEPIPPGKEVQAGDKLGELETMKVTFDLQSPVCGRVVEVNEELEAHPELINSDPYGSGWICRIELSDPEGEKNRLLQAKVYMELMNEKIEREAM